MNEQPSSAQAIVDRIVEPGSFTSWDRPAAPTDRRLQTDSADTGSDEAIITGEGVVGGHRIALVASDFDVAGGSLGLVSADRVARAIDRARCGGQTYAPAAVR